MPSTGNPWSNRNLGDCLSWLSMSTFPCCPTHASALGRPDSEWEPHADRRLLRSAEKHTLLPGLSISILLNSTIRSAQRKLERRITSYRSEDYPRHAPAKSDCRHLSEPEGPACGSNKWRCRPGRMSLGAEPSLSDDPTRPRPQVRACRAERDRGLVPGSSNPEVGPPVVKLTGNARALSEVARSARPQTSSAVNRATFDKGVRSEPLARRARAPSSYGF